MTGHAVRWAIRRNRFAPRGFDFTHWHWTLDANTTLCGRRIIIGRDDVPLFPETDDLSDVVDCKICRRRLTLFGADAEQQQALGEQETPRRCLILWGSRGTGKTHLCAAVVNRLRERGVSAGFFTAPDLLDMLRSGYARGDYDELLNGLRNLDVLALDDLGVEKETDWATEKLFQIINHRYNKNLPLMISTNMNPELFEARLADRLCDNAWSLRIQLGAESWRRKTP